MKNITTKLRAATIHRTYKRIEPSSNKIWRLAKQVRPNLWEMIRDHIINQIRSDTK